MNDFLRQHIETITPLTNEEYDYVKTHFTTRRIKKHQFLIHEGDDVLNDFLVVKGFLKSYHTDKKGNEHILQFAMTDWWITDYQSYFKQTKASITIECIEASEVLVLSLHNREKLCSELHKIDHFFRRKSNLGYVALQQRILSLLNSSAKERYEQLLHQYPQLFQMASKQLIAAYLGVSRETLSRLHTKDVT